jgi:hypothetical protein
VKKIIAIVGLFVFLFDVAGIFFVYKTKQILIRQQIEEQIKNGINKNELIKIIVNPENAYKVEWQNKNEFRIDGISYDIVSKNNFGEKTTIYYCINDKQETILFSRLLKMKRRKDSKNHDGTTASKFFKLLQNMDYVVHKEPLTNNFSKLLSNTNGGNHYISPLLSILSPPPKQ